MKYSFSTDLRYSVYSMVVIVNIIFFTACSSSNDNHSSNSYISDDKVITSAVESNSYGPEWLNGTWSGRFKIRSIDVDNNQVDEGTYYVEDGVIRAFYPIAGGTTVTHDIDEQNHRIDYGEGHYLRKQ